MASPQSNKRVPPASVAPASRRCPLPSPGDVFVIVGTNGLWLRLTFVRFHGSQSDIGVFRDDDGTELVIPTDQVRRQAPGVAGVAPASRRCLGPQAPSPEPLSPAQRRSIFSLARSRGLDLDDIRALCPRGHVSTLTRGQAAALIDRLDGREAARPNAPGLGSRVSGPGSRSPSPDSSATSAQLAFASDLAAGAGLDRRDLARWLHRRYGVESLADESLTRSDLNKIIGAFRRMRMKELGARGSDPRLREARYGGRRKVGSRAPSPQPRTPIPSFFWRFQWGMTLSPLASVAPASRRCYGAATCAAARWLRATPWSATTCT